MRTHRGKKASIKVAFWGLFQQSGMFGPGDTIAPKCTVYSNMLMAASTEDEEHTDEEEEDVEGQDTE